MMPLRDFAKREGFTKAQAQDLAERGLILGADRNPYSKQWRVEAPAVLVDWLEALDKPTTESESQGAARSSRAGVMGADHADTPPAPAGLAASLLSLVDQQAPQGRADGFDLAEDSGSAPPAACEDGAHDEAEHAPVSVFRSPKVRSCCESIDAAAQRSREVFSFTFTEEQRRAVSHALLEIATDLEEGDEAHDPWIQEEIARLCAVREMLEEAFYQHRRATA